MDPGSARWRFGFDVAVALVFTVFCLVVTDHIPPEDGERYNGWGVATIIVVGAALLLNRRLPTCGSASSIAGRHLHGGELRRGRCPRAAVPLYTLASTATDAGPGQRS